MPQGQFSNTLKTPDSKPTSKPSVALKKIHKAAARVENSIRVIREAMQATHRIFDSGKRQLIEVPDHKTRLAAVTLLLAYKEGRPVQRAAEITAKFESAEQVLERLNKSVDGRKALEIIDHLARGNMALSNP
jgi:hypothetical protein